MYAFGFIDKAARFGSLLPELTNLVARTPGLSNLAKLAAGMDQERQIPAFAPTTLQAWFRRRRGTTTPFGPEVVLWPDTFNNYFHTQVGVACIEALEAVGYRVTMPRGHVCCGRPLYDYGFLDTAERYLRRTLRELRESIRKGTPIIGMEPSCVAVLRDELKNMLPHDDDADRLARNVYHWPEFFETFNVRLPKLARDAVVWGHCHHKATGGMEPEVKLLRDRMHMDVREAKGGCCGLAGSWGFERGKYNISMRCGEVGLLPAAREAEPDTVIIADGFSCKTQVEQASVGRKALHTAEVMKMAREHPGAGPRGPRPERGLPGPPPAPLLARIARLGAAVGVGVLAWTAARAYLARS